MFKAGYIFVKKLLRNKCLYGTGKSTSMNTPGTFAFKNQLAECKGKRYTLLLYIITG